jgi:hypothetical protein
VFGPAAGNGLTPELTFTVEIQPAAWHGWWTVTSQGIYFADLSRGYGPDAAKPVNVYSFETRRIKRAAAIEGEVLPDLPDFCVSPDGRRMLYAIERLSNADIHMLDPFE